MPPGHSGCSSSQHPSQEDPGRAAALSVLSSICPGPAVSPGCPSGQGDAVECPLHLQTTQCPQERHTATCCDDTLDRCWEKGAQCHQHPQEQWACRLADMPPGRAHLWQAQSGIWESLAISCHCPFPEPQAHRLRAIGLVGLAQVRGGWATLHSPRGKWVYNQSWKRFPAEL